jgi:hypothetical protein
MKARRNKHRTNSVHEGKGEGYGKWPSPDFQGRRCSVVTTTVSREIVDVLAEEMAWGVERAVEYWMSQVEHALTDRQLTSLGRLYAVKDVVERYKGETGKAGFEARRA